MCLLEPKEEVVKLKISIFDNCQLRGCYIQPPKKPQKVLVMVVFFHVYIAVISLVFELKQNLEAKPYPEMNP